jgi:hypothetical protein
VGTAKPKAFLAKCKQSNRKHRPVRLLYEKWALYVKGIKQSKIDKNILYTTLFAPHTIQYWERHHDLKIDPNNPVDWEPSRKPMKKLPQGYRRWMVKQLSGHKVVGHMLKNENGRTIPDAHYATLKIEKHLTSSYAKTEHQKKTSKKHLTKS